MSEANLRSRDRLGDRRYPHMSSSDCKIWSRALSLGLVCFDRYEYDVCLGGKAAAKVPHEHELKPMWDSLCKKRIDVIGWTGKEATIIEVKPSAGFAALGQILGYAWLWTREHPDVTTARPIIVCDYLDEDLPEFFAHLGISVLQLPASSLSRP